MAQKLGASFIETSAKDNKNVREYPPGGRPMTPRTLQVDLDGLISLDHPNPPHRTSV